MADLYDYYNVNDDNQASWFGATSWGAQTFTTGVSDYQATLVKLKFNNKIGTPPDWTTAIRATDGTLPTGSDLISATAIVTGVDTGSAGTVITFDLGAGVTLSANTKYTIIFRCVTADVNNRVYTKGDFTSPTYSGGSLVQSTDAGVSWSEVTSIDMYFEVWGNAISSTSIKKISKLLYASIKNIGRLPIASCKKIGELS